MSQARLIFWGQLLIAFALLLPAPAACSRQQEEPDRDARGEGTPDPSRRADRPADRPADRGGVSPGAGPGSSPAVNCGSVSAWDSDGDGISDSLELNNLQSGYVPFNLDGCDRDPSRAVGNYSQGSLDGAVNIVDRGDGYVHLRGDDPVDSDDWATLALAGCLEAVAREWRETGMTLYVNDLSRRRGGSFRPPHISHQNGLDADLRYLRTDNRNLPLDIRDNPDRYDALATRALFELIIRTCDVKLVLTDLANLGFTNDELPGPVVIQAPGHSNHFHLRLKKPAS